MPCKIPRGPAGVLYLVTSPCLQAVKIGYWRSDLESLRRRYATVYGPDLHLQTKQVSDCRSIEAFVHLRFQKHRLGGELFDKAFLHEYTACLKTAGELVPVLQHRRQKKDRVAGLDNMSA